MRANHPKGVVLEGTFTPSPSAASLTKAAHLQKAEGSDSSDGPFLCRLGASDGPGTNQMPRGMAVKFALPDGTKTDLVVLSFNGFPVANAEEFRDFLLASPQAAPMLQNPRSWKSSWGPTRPQKPS